MLKMLVGYSPPNSVFKQCGEEEPDMGKITTRRHCKTCGQKRLFEKEKQNNLLHLILSLVTVGIWLPVWILIAVLGAFKPYRCTVCGESKL